MKYLLKVLITPSCWIQNNKYSAIWDDKLNRLMATHKFEHLNSCESKLGGLIIWIENHPYASFTYTRIKVRPSRRTILRAFEKLQKDLIVI